LAFTMAAAVAVTLSCVHPVTAQLPAPPVVGDGPFQLGGWGDVTVGRAWQVDGTRKLDATDLAAAVMAWGQLGARASYFFEMDVAKRTAETWTGREADQRFAPVRMYLEYSFNDLLRVRAGRFLTPIGQWNEAFAAPLTWTPTRPLATFRPFAKSLTGLLVAGSGSLGGHDAGYALFWAPIGDFDHDIDDAQESSFKHAFGGRAAVELHQGITLGASAARLQRSRPHDAEGYAYGEAYASADDLPLRSTSFQGAEDPGPTLRDEDATARTLLAADFRWEGERAQLLAEGTWLMASAPAPYEGGMFVLGALRLVGPVWGVGKVERYQPVEGQIAHLGYVGLTGRFSPHLVIKAGRELTDWTSPRIPDGWFLSFSSLFSAEAAGRRRQVRARRAPCAWWRTSPGIPPTPTSSSSDVSFSSASGSGPTAPLHAPSTSRPRPPFASSSARPSSVRR
jgi:hypothetical protein